ncbi:MAG: FHA domain-containing protein [Bradyrhizobiaceae bacterium]|nr:FHA domain-containing protein [Bradyrhizobiaceae bacterium]
MIWVEILSRHRDVAARFRMAGDEAHIGRGYGNDVIVDDPYVANRHVRIFRDDTGQLVAEDAGSKNGLFLDRDGVRQVRIVIDPDRPIRIGQTRLRIRDASHAVPVERLARTPPQAWLAALAAGLGASALGFEALLIWLRQTGEPRASIYLNWLLLVCAWVLAWVSLWAVLSRVFSGQARFLQNLLIALSGFLLLTLVSELSQVAAFSFSWPGAITYEYALQSAIIAAVCFFHLRETSRSRLALKGAAVAVLLVLAIAVRTVLRSEAVADLGQQTTVHRLMPPAFRLAPVRDEGDFFADVERLKAGLDRDRAQAR